jgi:hypothetical protein
MHSTTYRCAVYIPAQWLLVLIHILLLLVFARIITFVGGWLAGSLGVDVPPLGVESFPFGSAIITSVGMFGIEEAYGMSGRSLVGGLLLVG